MRRCAWVLALVALTAVGCAPRDVRVGRRAMSEGRFDIAAERFATAAAAEPENAARWLELARAELMADRPERARMAFARLASLRPTDPRPLVEIGFTHELERDYAAALRVYVQATERAPSDAYPHRVLGTRLLRWHQPDEALAPLERATSLEPRHAETWRALGLARHHAGDLEGAEAAFRKGLEHGPERSLSLSLAALLVNAGRYEEALGTYDAVVEQEPRFAAAHVGRALLLHELGRPDDAEGAFQRAIDVSDDPRPYMARLAEYRRFRAAGGAATDPTRQPRGGAANGAPPESNRRGAASGVGTEAPVGAPTGAETGGAPTGAETGAETEPGADSDAETDPDTESGAATSLTMPLPLD